MPVFARTKLYMEEYCLTHYRPRVELTFTGPNPQNIYPKIMDILTRNVIVPRENIQEKGFRWDRSGATETFSAAIEAVKDFDKFSYMYFTIDITGNIKPSKEFGKEGNVTIIIEGRVVTEYPQDTVWERSFLYEVFRMFYHRVLYQDARYKYLHNCREWMIVMQNEIKSFFNILQKA
ncbi:MAG: hypothetical protein HY361_02925 [Candidatus Aenigmarchaeota archaeon]|nr:hypothetical protein [Candidatus Aenigmarchaeota archaeon]